MCLVRYSIYGYVQEPPSLPKKTVVPWMYLPARCVYVDLLRVNLAARALFFHRHSGSVILRHLAFLSPMTLSLWAEATLDVTLHFAGCSRRLMLHPTIAIKPIKII